MKRILMIGKDKGNSIFTTILQFFDGITGQHYEKKSYSESEKTEKNEYERCVICGNLTCIPVSMQVEWRENYEIGMGQICAVCAKKQREEEEK